MAPKQLLSNKSQQILLENETLLRALNKYPGPSQRYPYTGERSQDRKLSLGREEQLAGTFAYLSATTDDTRKVMAACVEEAAESRGLIVRLASNSGDLSEVKAGLETLARSIAAASDQKLCV